VHDENHERRSTDNNCYTSQSCLFVAVVFLQNISVIGQHCPELTGLTSIDTLGIEASNFSSIRVGRVCHDDTPTEGFKTHAEISWVISTHPGEIYVPSNASYPSSWSLQTTPEGLVKPLIFDDELQLGYSDEGPSEVYAG
jgi:hypothetical protein